MLGLSFLILAAEVLPGGPSASPAAPRWTTQCPAARRAELPSCLTRLRVPEVEIGVRVDRRRVRLEVAVDARDPFSGERCEWWRSAALPDMAAAPDPAKIAARINQRITLLTYECRPSRLPQLDREDGAHLIRFVAEGRATLAVGETGR